MLLLLLHERAAAAAVVPETEDPCCTCSDLPRGENLERLREYVHRAGEHQEHRELVLQQQMLWKNVLQKRENSVSKKQQMMYCLQQQQGPRFPAPGDGACSDTAETLKETERDADIAGETGTGTPKQPRREQQV